MQFRVSGEVHGLFEKNLNLEIPYIARGSQGQDRQCPIFRKETSKEALETCVGERNGSIELTVIATRAAPIIQIMQGGGELLFIPAQLPKYSGEFHLLN